MTDIVRGQLKMKLPIQFIRLTAEIRAAGFRQGVSISTAGQVKPTQAALKAGPSHKRVIKRHGTVNKWITALNKRYQEWALFYRP